MSETERLELLVSTIAVVFDPTHQPSPISIPSDLTGILRQPVNVSGDPLGQLVLTSTRDQTELILSGNKIDVRDLSGKLDQGVAKIPRIVHELGALLGNPGLRSYGINFILELSKDDATNWLATNLLSPVVRESLEGQLSSNHINLTLHRPPKTLAIQLASSVVDKINVNFNASGEATELPSAEHLRQDMDDQYRTLIGLLEQLEG